MALPEWTVRTGYDLGTIDERTNTSLRLPLRDTDGVTVNVIAGTLPPGLRIEDYNLKGVPFEVNRTKDFEFTIRASTVEGISDRTFTLRVLGEDAPQWVTPSGTLAVKNNLAEIYWVDTVNTRWGLYATGGTSAFSEVDVTLFETKPTTQGSNGDYGFDFSSSKFYYKSSGRWREMTTKILQSSLGSDISIASSATVPNANIVDYWLNTNKDNNGLDLKIRRFNEPSQQWVNVDYFVQKTAPITPGDDTIWVQTFEDSLSWIIKTYNASESIWELLDFEYSNVPPQRKNSSYFVLDNSLVDFQLEAIDTDLAAGENLTYYIADDDGELPPGLSLSSDGRITGIVDPILALDANIVPGFDNNTYDSVPLDYAVPDDNGYDSYYYDTVFYGFSERTRSPKKLNRFYEFTVTVADDVGESKRTFLIYVVGDDFLRADNTIMKAGTGIFTADNTFLRNPLWLTNGDLGVKRADNYITLYLDVFDPNSLLGTITYILKPYNDDGTLSELPAGLEIDSNTGEIAGRVSYMPAVSKDYRFTVEALRTDSDLDSVEINIGTYEDTLSGKTQLKIQKLPLGTADGVSDLESLVGQNINIENIEYTVELTDDSNIDYDLLTLTTPLEPTYRANVITIREQANNGDTSIIINELSEADVEFYKNKILIFNDSEKYRILDELDYRKTTRYVNYDIGTTVGAPGLQFNYELVGLTPVPGETVFQATQRYIKQLVNTGTSTLIQDEEIVLKVSNSERLVFDVKATAITRNIGLIEKAFSAADSSPIYVERTNDFHKMFLSNSLTRTLPRYNQYSIGVPKDITIVKRLNVANNDIASTVKTFTLTLVGEIESTITWLTEPVLPTIVANRVSYLRVEAETTLTDSNLKYNVIKGKLPNGLSLKQDGEIVGKVNQYANETSLGLTTIDNRATTFDASSTTIDRQFKFTVLARDRFGYSSITREFTINVDDIDDKVYSNIYMQPFMKRELRTNFETFINDYTVFTPEYIYRPSDNNFGLQKNLRSLVFAGIEQKTLDAYIAAVALNHKKKRYAIGDIKTAQAKQPGSNEVVYEVVYLDLIDPQEPTAGKTALKTKIRTKETVKVNQVKLEILDDETSTESGVDAFNITTRENGIVRVRADAGNINITLRDGTVVVYQAAGQIDLVMQDGSVVVVRSENSITNTSGDPLRFRPTSPVITADSNALLASQSKDQYRYISNISNSRQRIKDVGADERQYLPLWMRTSQGSNIQEIDYVTAVPICYCKPGTAQLIVENIINNGFDFSTLDYEIDRYIIDSTTGNQDEQYILFSNYKFNV